MYTFSNTSRLLIRPTPRKRESSDSSRISTSLAAPPSVHKLHDGDADRLLGLEVELRLAQLIMFLCFWRDNSMDSLTRSFLAGYLLQSWVLRPFLNPPLAWFSCQAHGFGFLFCSCRRSPREKHKSCLLILLLYGLIRLIC